MFIKTIKNGKWEENCYVINNHLNEAIIIDPGSDEIIIEEYCLKSNLKILGIINTHGHYDHIGAIDYIRKKFNTFFYMHSQDKKLIKSSNLYSKIFDGEGSIKIPKIDYFVDELKFPLVLGGFKIDFIFTPGHTKGSICILIDNFLFTGDTLLKGKVGRVDLPGGNLESLHQSLKLISKLPGEIKIFPGHGDSSTIKDQLPLIKKNT